MKRYGGDQLDQPFVYPHLVVVPSLASLATWRLSGRDLQVLGRKPDRAFDLEVLQFRTLDELRANFLERFDIA